MNIKVRGVCALLQVFDMPTSRDPARATSHSDTGLFFDCADVDEAYRHLRAHNVEVGPPKVAPYGMKQLFVRDPDGYSLCFQCAAPC